VPLLTLGIPGSGTTAILLAALVLWGFKPGPLFIEESPALFWGLVESLFFVMVLLLHISVKLLLVVSELLKLPASAL
jgi:putative tricarboxylic transport membrane protein